MKKQNIYSALVLTALLTAGCSKEIENTLESTDSAAIELSSVSTDPMTKAVITGTSFTTDEADAGIGLFLLDGNGKAYGNNAGNVRYAHNDGKWTASQPLRIGNTEGTLVGYYPYSEGATDVKAIPVASSINGADYLYGSIAGLTSAKAKSESLTLSHALTRLRITFKRDNSFVGSGTLSSLTIEGNGIAASGTLNATTGEISATNASFTVSNLNATINTDGITEDCLVVPATSSATPQAVTLKFTVDGKAYKVDLADDLAVKLQSGIQTDITLTVKNTSVSVDGSSIGAWGDGGSQTVTVGGNYTVTVLLSDAVEDAGIADDAWIKNVEVVDNCVKIIAQSITGKHLKCTMSDGEFCTSQSKEYGPVRYDKDGKDDGYQYFVYSFIISDITSNTTATIGYANPVSIGVTPSGAGSVEISGGELYEGETVTLKAIPAYEYGFDAWLDNNSEPLSCEDETYTNIRLSTNMGVKFKENLLLDGEFTVAAGKKVRFTRGNLYFDSEDRKIEQHQYDFNSGTWTKGGHISHFMWCNDIGYTTRQQYNTSWNGQDTFFTENNFTVRGFSNNQCHALTSAEWQYLFSYGDYDNDVRRGKYKLGVTVCDKNNCIVLLPDNWTGDTIESSYDYVGWKHMEAAGAVCLPAAGCRDGFNGNTYVNLAGSLGYYWSASPLVDIYAFDLYFGSGDVNPYHFDERSQAYAVRLVTESNQ